ncbi:hypothetical protein [Thalassobacillus sp. CUG 92003]|uniref:hypothetical protein n=1 Tax=Thalassobacillus sp. CUG 92003 TaxID=2736641 RepID=UPI0015E72114|nr:hypothetical protein [Thalassobacillus sp. CUG 92003]
MVINILFGAVIPWILTALLFLRKPALVILLFPLGAMIAFGLNDWGFRVFWLVSPFHDNPSLPALPFNLGYFPMLACYFGYFNYIRLLETKMLIVVFSLITTSLEFMALLVDKVHFYNQWNIFYSLLVYLLGFSVVVIYVKLLKKYNIADYTS